MKDCLRLVYATGDVAATLLRPWQWSYAFLALLYPFYIKSEIPIRFFYDLGASAALLPVSTIIRVILTKISNRCGVAVQWNWGFTHLLADEYDNDTYLIDSFMLLLCLPHWLHHPYQLYFWSSQLSMFCFHFYIILNKRAVETMN